MVHSSIPPFNYQEDEGLIRYVVNRLVQKPIREYRHHRRLEDAEKTTTERNRKVVEMMKR